MKHSYSVVTVLELFKGVQKLICAPVLKISRPSALILHHIECKTQKKKNLPDIQLFIFLWTLEILVFSQKIILLRANVWNRERKKFINLLLISSGADSIDSLWMFNAPNQKQRDDSSRFQKCFIFHPTSQIFQIMSNKQREGKRGAVF